MFTLVGASVDIPYKVYKVLGYLGRKLYFLRLPKENKTEDERLKHSREDFSQKQENVQSALFDYLKWLEIRPDMAVDKDSGLPNIQWDFSRDDEMAERYIPRLADLLAHLRGVALTWETRDTQGSDYGYTKPIIQDPSRATTQLKNLARGHALLHGRNYITQEDIPIVVKTVLSTASVERVSVLDKLLTNNGTLTTTQVVGALNISPPTARRTMTELSVLFLNIGNSGQKVVVALLSSIVAILNKTKTAVSTIFCVLCLLLAANLLIVLGNNSHSTVVGSFGNEIKKIGNQRLDTNIILVWNNLTTKLGIDEKLTPPAFARVYALVHISIYDSLIAATEGKEVLSYFGNVDNNKSSFYVNVIAEAASNVLLYFFPNHANDIIKLKSTQIGQFPSNDDGNLSIEKASIIGHRVSQAIINYAETDNSDIVWNKNTTTILSVKNSTDCTWNGTNPVNPIAGFWKTHILKSGAEIQPKGPAPCGSEADLLDLKETYEMWKHRTPNQIKAAHYWGDKSPPVIWNSILNQHIQKYYKNMSIFDAAYVNAYLNVGMYDAFASCWYTKYSYWSARPFQRIPNIITEIPTPNFPSYTSGHSVISMVASRVLGEMFPNEKDHFHNQAIEAGLSRIWAGIHFKQDVIQGMNQGEKIADKVLEDMHKPYSSFIYTTFR